MSQGKNVSAKSGSSGKSVAVRCPCGYSAKIPSSFDGKKMACPNCRNVLSVMRAKRALLLTQCPYCQKAHRYDGKIDACRSCKKAFRPPKIIDTIKQQSDSEGTKESLVALDTSSLDSLIGSDAQPQISVTVVPKKSRKKSLVWQFLPSIFCMGGTAIITWVVLGDRLEHQHSISISGSEQKKPALIASVKTQNKSIASAKIQDKSIDLQLRNNPKLLSPSVAILDGQFIVDQALDQLTSKPVGNKTMIDLQVKNLTRCHISNIAFTLDCTRNDGGSKGFKIDEVRFSRGLKPEASGVLTLACEPGDWDTVAVTIVSVESENEFDSTKIGPFVIKKNDRITER